MHLSLWNLFIQISRTKWKDGWYFPCYWTLPFWIIVLTIFIHVPIIAEVKSKEKEARKKPKIIYKRCLKDFTAEGWKKCLAKKRWEKLGETDIIKLSSPWSPTLVSSYLILRPISDFPASVLYKLVTIRICYLFE